MLLTWLRRRRRRKLLSEPFPPEWARYLEAHVAFYKTLAEDERRRLQGIARVLMAEKNWFAHNLDMLDAYADGTPPLESREQYTAWVKIMTGEYKELLDSAEKGRATLLDKYGASNPAEFFAVATERFFERPRKIKEKHPALYDLLRDYYRQDPAMRL